MTGKLVRAAAVLVVGMIAVLVVIGTAPYAFRERHAQGSVPDTAASLPGQAAQVTDALRGLGYACSDAIIASDTVTRSCSQVRYLAIAQVRMLVAHATGVVLLATTAIDDDGASVKTHREILGVLGRAVGLPPAEEAQLVAAATGTTEAVFDFGWGSVTVRPGPAPESTLRAATSTGLALPSSPTTLGVPVDALASAAEANGYACVTPQVQTIRSCARSDGAYDDDLWLQGTDTYTTSVSLSVSSIYHTRTRRHWIQTMTETMGWVDTDQTRAVRTWLADSADAPGADGYVDGLPISFLVRTDTRDKETFGGIAAECAANIDDISSCDP